MKILMQLGVGVEAGLASVDDARRLLGVPDHHRVLRVLIELDNERDLALAMKVCDGVLSVLRDGGVLKPILLHGYDDTVWPFVERARAERLSTRVGLEDGRLLPDGRFARDNADLVAAAARLFRR